MGAAPGEPCYLVEWYRPDFASEPPECTAAKVEDCAAAMCANGASVQLLAVLVVPSDEVVFAVFAAGSAAVVAEACQRAGHPPARLTVAARIASRS
ncbi:MAG: hypothetical protein QOF36_1225 [Microbacteriaceae bacterium]|jgi:hypothetical protein|nr:hypothetical protein [Microbacteriaceae bacterium]